MPSFIDEYTFEIEASFDINAGEEVPDEEAPEHKLGTAGGGKTAEKCAVRNILTGSFIVTSPSADNHGPVRVAGTYYLAYEDGTPYHCIGTTCYVWNLQNEELQKQTLKTLEENAFNKIRFCIFPKHYDYNLHEPITYPVSYTHLVEDVIPAISIPEDGPVYLRVITTQEGLYAKFFYSLDGKDYQELAEVPTNILTDEQRCV